MVQIITRHTADIGVKEKAKDLKTLYKKCVDRIIKLALKKNTDITELRKKTIIIKNNNNSSEELLHDFLNEILYFIFVKKKYPVKTYIKEVCPDKIKADVFLKKIKREHIMRELKSVTYHNLKVKKNKDNYTAEFVIDI